MRQVIPHVVIAGAVILALEILGTRILGPFYGVSLYLWSALITVTLASLSLGYYVGGKRADRNPAMVSLTKIFAATGLWLVLLPHFSHQVIDAFRPLGLRTALLTSSAVLFAPPLTLLGMVAPYAVRLATARVESVGSTAGALYALSTLASVAAGLLTGFVLIPELGINKMLLLLAFLLFLTSLYSLFMQRGRSTSALSVIVVLTATSAVLFARASDGSERALTVVQSAYGEIRAQDTDHGRYLLIDGTVHSLVDTVYWQSLLEYVAVMEIPRYCFHQPGTALLIGIGAGSLAKRYTSFGWSVDAVEIDPSVVAVAKEHFRFSEEDAVIIHDDGRRLVSDTEDRYDIILLDAFGSSAIPFHLITTEAFEILESRLKPGGILAVNLWAWGWNDIIVRSVGATLMGTFSHVIALPIAEPPNRLGNVVMLSRNEPLTLERELERQYHNPYYRYGPMYFRVHAWDNQFVPDISHAPVLTDDLNPVDLWSERINRQAREELLQMFSEMGIEW